MPNIRDSSKELTRFAASMRQAHRLFEQYGGVSVTARQTMSRSRQLAVTAKRAPTEEAVEAELEALEEQLD